MGFKDFLRRFIGFDDKAACVGYSEEWNTLAIRKLCFWACVSTVANAISVCEFKTFVRGEEVKGPEYYSWNVEPNKNQSSAEFKQKLISQLFSDSEALIIEDSGQFFIADSYNYNQKGTKEGIFTQVAISGETITGFYMQSEVIYIKLSDENIKTLVDSIFGLYKELINYGIGSYKNDAGNKGIVSKDATQNGNAQQQKKELEDLREQFDEFFKSKNSVMLMPKGFSYKDLSSGATRSSANQNTRDIRELINDIMDYTAVAFGIPSMLLSGKVENTSNALDQFLTLCINPLVGQIAEGINRKRYRGKAYAEGSYLKIDTKTVKHVDLLSVSTAIDKLIGSGSFSINDIREVVGEPPINEDWANQHFITKNYSTIEEALSVLTGGDDPGG